MKNTKNSAIRSKSDVPAKINVKDKTPAATFVQPVSGVAFNKGSISYQELREIAQFPTIKSALDILVGEVTASPWVVSWNDSCSWNPENEGWTKENIIDLLQNTIDQFSNDLIERSFRQSLICGWCPVVIFDHYDKDKNVWLPKKLKQLLPEWTWILQSPDGEFDGFEDRQIGVNMPENFDGNGMFQRISSASCLLINHDQLGDKLYGESILSGILPLFKDLELVYGKYHQYLSTISGGILDIHTFGEPETWDEVTRQSINSIVESISEGRLVAVANRVREQGVGTYRPDFEFFPITLPSPTVGAGEFKQRQDDLYRLFSIGIGVSPEALQLGQNGSYSSRAVMDETQKTIFNGKERRFIDQAPNKIIDHITFNNWGVTGICHIVASSKDSEMSILKELYPLVKDDPLVDRASMLEKMGISIIDSNIDTNFSKEENGDIVSEAGVVTGTESVADTAFNGAQLQSAVEVIIRVQDGSLTKESAIELMDMAFPAIPRERLVRMVESAQSNIDVVGDDVKVDEKSDLDNAGFDASVIGARFDSLAIGDTRYDDEEQKLYYRYRSGDKIYVTDLSNKKYDELLKADSVGRFFNDEIKPLWDGETASSLPESDYISKSGAKRVEKDQMVEDDSTSWTLDFWKRVDKEMREQSPPNIEELDRLEGRDREMRIDALVTQMQLSFDKKDASRYAQNLAEYEYMTGKVPAPIVEAAKRGEPVSIVPESKESIDKRAKSWLNQFVSKIFRRNR